eukprot:339472-Amphidinium_carterae.1
MDFWSICQKGGSHDGQHMNIFMIGKSSRENFMLTNKAQKKGNVSWVTQPGFDFSQAQPWRASTCSAGFAHVFYRLTADWLISGNPCMQSL